MLLLRMWLKKKVYNFYTKTIVLYRTKWQIFIYQNRIIRIYGHEGMGVI